MQYGSVAGLDKPVSRLIIGSDHLSDDRPEQAFALLDAAFEAGINTVDSAHIYGGGSGQRVVGQWLKSRGVRDKIVLFDKGCHPMGGPRLSPAHIESDLTENLERFGVDFVDVFTFHRDDPSVPVGPLVEALNKLRKDGKLAAFGASNWLVERIVQFNAYADQHNLSGFSLNNPNLSLATVNEPMWADAHTITVDERRWHERTQFPLFSWSSQGGGFFFGVESPDVERVYLNSVNLQRRARAEQMAKDKGLSIVTIVLAWTLCQPFPVYALIGARKPSELGPSIEALDVQLTPAELKWLEDGLA